MIPDYTPLFNWIREREAIRTLKDSGETPPWTADPILAAYRFCNVRREDDRVTRWIHQNIREPFADHPYLWLMLCIARQINWPDTLAELMNTTGAWPGHITFSPKIMTATLNARKTRGSKVYTGAYMISAPATKGADKQAYIAETVIGDLWWNRTGEFVDWRGATLQATHRKLTRTNGWGDFMAYQAIVDMRFTHLLECALDRETWAAAGPGTIHGLNRLHGRPVDCSLSQDQALKEMQLIYSVAEAETGIRLDFSDIPNTLCETDKYLRVALKQGKPRARYVVGRGS